MRRTLKVTAAVVIGALVAQPVMTAPGYAQSVYNGTPTRLAGKTNVEKSIGKCVGSVLFGGIVGAIVGGEEGAAIGVAAGGLVCALIMRGASKKDQALLREGYLQVLNTDQGFTNSWQTEDGSRAQAVYSPGPTTSLVMTSSGSIYCNKSGSCKIGDEWFSKEQVLSRQAATDAPKVVKAAFETAELTQCKKPSLKYNIDGTLASQSDELTCRRGDEWVTVSLFKKQKINQSHIEFQ